MTPHCESNKVQIQVGDTTAGRRQPHSSGSRPIANRISTVTKHAFKVLFHCLSSLFQEYLSFLPFPDYEICLILPGPHLSPIGGHLCCLSCSVPTNRVYFLRHLSGWCVRGENIAGRLGMPWKWRPRLGELCILHPCPKDYPTHWLENSQGHPKDA